MDPDTDIGGPAHRFPVTNHSAIINARSDDTSVRRRAFDTIVASYWKPAYKYIRLKWQADNEDAKDLTQSFFAHAVEKNHFATYDARKASFQTFCARVSTALSLTNAKPDAAQAWRRHGPLSSSTSLWRKMSSPRTLHLRSARKTIFIASGCVGCSLFLSKRFGNAAKSRVAPFTFNCSSVTT